MTNTGLKALLRASMKQGIIDQRNVPSSLSDGVKEPDLTVAETMLLDRLVNLADYAVQAYGMSQEAKRKETAAVALKDALENFTDDFGSDPKGWPDEEYFRLTAAFEALDKAKGAGL